MNDQSIKIMVCCHKPYHYPKDPLYLPIQVGKALKDLDLGFQTDDLCMGEACDNISKLNGIYCEMTAMYWAWKNIRRVYPDIQYVGLCHYRRYFNTENHAVTYWLKKAVKMGGKLISVISGKGLGLLYTEPCSKIASLEDERFARTTARLREIIPRYDIVSTKPIRIVNMNVEGFFNVIGRQYIELLQEIVRKDYPDYYSALETVLSGSKLHAANMIILRTEYLDEYCGFVFGVLEKHLDAVKETKLCLDPETEGMYARIPGYLAEILTSTYIQSKQGKLKCKSVEKYFVK